MSIRNRHLLGYFVPTFLVFSSLSANAADWPVLRGPSHEPEPFRFDPSQIKKAPKEFLEDASACTLYAGSTYNFEADGTIETITHEITRFNGRKGIEKLGEYRNIVFDPSYQKLMLNEARIHKVNGHVVAIEPKHVQLRDVVTDFQVYDHEKQLVISFPNLEVGDCIEVKWTTGGRNSEHQGYFFTRYSFGDDTLPVVIDDLRVRLPVTKVLKYAFTGGKLDAEITENAGWRTYHWKALLCKQLPMDDNLPSKEDLRLQVSLTTFGSWNEVAQWYKKLGADSWKCTPEVRKVVDEVTKNLTETEAKAKALTYWVRRNIRYVSNGEKHDYTPHAPAQVLGNRYGDCKDQSQLLAVMLHEAGVPVAQATLGTLDDGQVLEENPSPWGTHAILVVPLEGTNHWIDTTASLAAWDFLPREDRNRLAYVIDDSGIQLIQTPPMNPEDNSTEQTTEVWISADGSARYESTVDYRGLAGMVQRDSWLETPPGERHRVLANELQDSNKHSRLKQLLVNDANLKDFDAPVRAQVVFAIPNQFGADSDIEGSLTDSKVWGRLLSFNPDYDRQPDIDLGSPFESRHRYILHLPPAFRLKSLPGDHTVQSQWGQFRLHVRSEDESDRLVRFDMYTRLEKTHVAAADLDAFRRFQENVAKHYRVWLTLHPSNDLEDAALSEALLAWMPDNRPNALALARLYHANGMDSDASRVLRRVRFYHAYDETLWEWSVKVADNLDELAGLYSEMTRLFPDEVRYAVALGTALVDLGKLQNAKKVLLDASKKATGSLASQVHYQLARGAFASNDSTQALKHLDEAANADEENMNPAMVSLLRGQVLGYLGRWKEALETYRTVLKYEPNSEKVLKAIITLSFKIKDRGETLKYLHRYMVAVEDDANGLAQAAEWSCSLGYYEEALDLADRSTKLKPNAKAWQVLGLVYLHRQDFTQALTFLEKTTLSGPAFLGRLRCNLALGRLDKVIELANQLGTIEKPGQQSQRQENRLTN
jgi:tetratricopeptide (TPR) repeat protein